MTTDDYEIKETKSFEGNVGYMIFEKGCRLPVTLIWFETYNCAYDWIKNAELMARAADC